MPREQGGTSYGSLSQEFLPKFAETFFDRRGCIHCPDNRKKKDATASGFYKGIIRKIVAGKVELSISKMTSSGGISSSFC